MSRQKAITVISLGGSILTNKGNFDIQFVRAFKKLITALVKRGGRFVIVVGGGVVCREYQDHARSAGVKKTRDLDWIGIYATRLNAAFIKSLFSSFTTDDLAYGNLKQQAKRYPVLVLGGLKPGASSDHTTVQIAEEVGARTVLNLSNIEYVYDKDPRTHRNARPFKRLTWQEYFGIIGSKRVPGGNYPFDPVAARLAARLGITIHMVNGRHLQEVKKALAGKSFKGTIIE